MNIDSFILIIEQALYVLILVTNKLTIQFPNYALIDAVRITNFAGQEIYNARDAENPLTLDLSGYADGPYLIELTNASETYQERIVKISAN